MSDIAYSATHADIARQRYPGGIALVLRYVALAMGVRRERDRLAKLTSEQLADIGVSPEAAAREAERDLFDVPEHRKSWQHL